MALTQYLLTVARQILTQWRVSREPVYATYEDAVRSRGQDYHDEELAQVVLDKTRRYVGNAAFQHITEHQALGTILSVTTAALLAQRGDRPLRVLDFGGALGTSYHFVKDRLPRSYAWAVVETPVFVKAGREFETPEFRMFETIADATAWLGEIDLIYTSSALPYMPAPLSTIDEFIAANPQCIALMRSAFSEGEQVVVLQRSRLQHNGPGPLPAGVQDRPVFYPRTYAPLGGIKDRLSVRYRPIVEYGDGTPPTLVGNQRIAMGGNYIFARAP